MTWPSSIHLGGVSKTLGSATLRSIVKSHPDVGERWYPGILQDIREQQAEEARGGTRGLTADDVVKSAS
ncbi:hypothetical protein PG997_006043 [Apiospora hydei]|uniref:Uncharacterized protein n=1 Tax=Apiospora hydei TaxID=1337664 RepID=A0ABR1WP06_9PEZI